MATQTKDFVSGVFKQAGECFNQTMRTGIEFQEEAAKFWSDAFGRNFDQFRTQFDKVANDAVPAAKENLERFHDLFDGQAQESLDTLRKAFDVGQDFKVPNMVDQTADVWRKSFDVMRSNVDKLTKANVDMFESVCRTAEQCGAANGAKSSAKPQAK